MSASSLPAELTEKQLPSEVVTSSNFWLLRARNYPVFSKAWFRYRSYFWLTLCGLMGIPWFMIVSLYQQEKGVLFAIFLITAAACLSFLFIGPWLAVLVRQRAWPKKRETITLIMAVIIGNSLALGITAGVKYPIKWLIFGDIAHTINLEAHLTASVAADTPNASKEEIHQERQHRIENEVQRKITEKKEHPERYYFVKGFDYLTDFALIFLVGGGLDLFIFFRQRHRLTETQRQQELAAAKAARNEAELKLSVLAAQVEPHFLFNTLAGVRSAISCDPLRAVAIVDHLVEYLRATIPKIRIDGKSNQAELRTQIEAARAYLALMQQRIPRLQFSIEVDPDLEDAQLPPLMLISLVENAVKHGVEPKAGPACIVVSACAQQEGNHTMLQVNVCDDGIGFSQCASGSGIGLTNIRERLAAMYGAQATLALKANTNGGVTATLLLPLELHDDHRYPG